MSRLSILIAITLLVAIQTKLIPQQEHEQGTGFACCPDTYVFNPTTLSCVCPATLPFVDASGRCINCNAGSYYDENQKACATCPANTTPHPYTLQSPFKSIWNYYFLYFYLL